LERRGAHLAYVKTPGGYEVDFVARIPGGETLLIQVCEDISDARVYEREVRALEDAKAGYPRARRMLLVGQDLPRVSPPKGIVARYAPEWLLDESAL
jgi:predicted AAA+ superfamily ATPase